MRLVLLSLCFGTAAFGQIQELATNDDGSQLYFSTNYRIKGTEQFTNFKIIQLTAGMYSLTAQTKPAYTLANGVTIQTNLHYTSVSGDGSVIAYDQKIDCGGNSTTCAPLTPESAAGFAIGVDLPGELTSLGSLRVSHSGRYFLSFCCIGSGNPPTAEFYDAQTGILTPLPGSGAIEDGRHAIADNGTALLTDGPFAGHWYLWNKGNAAKLPFQSSVVTGSARLSVDGSTLIYQGSDPSSGEAALWIYNVQTGAKWILARGPIALAFAPLCGCPIVLGPYFKASLSNDASRVLFQASDPASGTPRFSTKPVQLFVINADGTGLTQLTHETSNIVESVLSGDGHRAYAVTKSGDLLAIDVDSATVTRLIGDLPAFGVNRIVPGSRAIAQGLNLTSQDGRVLLRFSAFDAPVISAAPNQVILQVPWELDVSQPVTLIASAAVSPFELAATYQPVMAAPSNLRLLHADFRGPPTESDPAHPGEILVIQMTGLGPVSPAIQTGKAAPDNPLSYAQLPVTCHWQQGNLDAPVLFAGLAPEFVGLFQVNVLVLPDVVANQPLVGTYLYCAVGELSGGSDFVYVSK